MTIELAPTTRTAKATAKPKVNLLKAPLVAWPTIATAFFGLGTWAVSAALFVAGVMPWWATLVVSSITAFVCFTPAHDASHKSLTRTAWPNEVIGRLCTIALTAPFPAFRYLHLQHHRHTNDHDHDPDMWSGRGPWFILPLRWMTQDLHYYAFYFKRIRERPIAESAETIGMLALQVAVAVTLTAMGYGFEVLIAWLIPARFAIMFLAFAFDYLPHVPHQVRGKDDRFKATIVRPTPWLTPVLLYQNFHLIHHLYPGVPFYRYGAVWRERKAKLVAKGAEARTVTGRVMEEHEIL